MGRDKVLGLSLAILLIGFAAAFCFRNEKIVESGLNLARTKILDEAIAQRPGPKPYVADAKTERRKSSSPSVTLQGVESVEPFSDLQSAQSPERTKTAARVEKSVETKIPAIADDSVATDPPAEPKPSAESRKPAEQQPAALGPMTTVADGQSVSIDEQKAAPEFSPSNSTSALPVGAAPSGPVPAAIKGVAPSPGVVASSATSSELLTSTAPPDAERHNSESQTASSENALRASSASNARSQTLVPQNVAWQPTPAQHPRDVLADNSPRRGSSSQDPPAPASESSPASPPAATQEATRDNWKHEECTRTRETSDDRSAEPPVSDKPTLKTRADESAAIIKPLETSPPANGTDGSTTTLTYRVRRGDTLSRIALHYLGDARLYREIFEANRDQLHTPNDRLKIGMTLRIPAETARPETARKSIVRRKRRSSHADQSATQTSRSHGASLHNVARVRETPSRTNNDAIPPADDANRTNDPQPSIRFVPVRRAPFVPGSKTDPDPATPAEKTDNAAPAPDMSHLNIFPKTESVRIAGDRDDAVVR